MTKTMRALILKTHGQLANLELIGDYPMPRAVIGHVVIRVRASSFNYHDLFTVKGMPGTRVPLPVVIGLDMAGEITELGGDIVNWKVGDRVLLDGGMAEYCLVSADQLVAIPDTVTFLPRRLLFPWYGTAHRMLITHNTVKQGDRYWYLVPVGASERGVS